MKIYKYKYTNKNSQIQMIKYTNANIYKSSLFCLSVCYMSVYCQGKCITSQRRRPAATPYTP